MAVRQWPQADYEEVTCCRCGISGQLLFTQRRFGIVQCPQCHLVFTSPRLKKEAIRNIYEASSYFDEGVYGFSKQINLGMLLQRAWTRGRLDLIRGLVKGDPHTKKMLEIGCAYGLFLQAARHQGFEVAGVEYSNTAVQWSAEHLGLPVQQGELKDAQLPSQRFDVICFWDVLEHVDNPVAFLKLVHQYLVPGGIVVFSTPYVNSLPARLLHSRWWTLRPEQHLWHFTPHTLGLLFADAGMHLEQVIADPLAPANIGRLDSLVGVVRVVACHAG
ncbi:MAG: class I SAM-dependent methyltransferase [Herpetosiphonaceae bacterium]|nr:class I SAM-dependent methyltransferase [Herpetosiphonaceae bacterium]